MHILTAEELRSRPQSLLADAERGEPALVVEDSRPVFMTVPMGRGLDAREVRLELAVGLFEREQVNVEVAARIAGLSITDMVDELCRRQIAVGRGGAVASGK